MDAIPTVDGLFIAAVLFVLGLLGVLVRRNLIIVLVSLEIMFNATGLAFVLAGAQWTEADGQIMFILIITLAATEASVGLALLLQLERRFGTLDVDAMNRMRG